MLLCALGINHKTAPVAIRERVVFGPDRHRDALRELRGLDGVAEAAIISTCNRTELYYGTEQDDERGVIEWLGRFHSLDTESLSPYVYFHRDDEAVRHLLRVASGLDSMILGEPQILGQVKQAYQQANDAETLGQVLGRLFQHTFSVAKQVRTETAIGSSPVSMAFAAVSLAKQILGDLSDQSALLIGAGETIELAARHLKESGLGNVIVANRSVDRARLLAAEFNGYAIGLDEIPAHLHEADIVIASTAAPNTVLNRPEVEKAIKKRKHRPVFMVDLAVPRDIAADVGKLEDVYLYTVDDLQEVVQEGLRTRQEAAEQAEDIIGNQVSHFMGWLRIMRGAETIRAYRQQAETTRDDLLAKARRQLAAGHPTDEVIEQLANTLTNKLIHAPCISMRQAFEQDHVEIIDTARVLLNIPRLAFMKASIRGKLEALSERHAEVAVLLSEPDVIGDQNQFRTLSQEYAQLEPVAQGWARYQTAQEDIAAAREMLADPELKDLAEDELRQAEGRVEQLEKELQFLLIPADPHDQSNVYLEIRAGTGGDEAAIFAGDLFRMYSRYAERRRWQVEVMSAHDGEHGGYKEIIARLTGQGVYGRLKFESGAHRVQRVPATETQGRIHTSAATVAVMPEIDEVEAPDINPADLRIDTYRASGAGGQHINKTDSAIRITHIPTGTVVECQEERSQHKNRAKAMNMLASRLLKAEQDKQAEQQASTRRNLVGSGDRSEKIRTYNYPQSRVTDHRINLTLYKLDDITSAGDLDPVIDPLLAEYQADQLAALAD